MVIDAKLREKLFCSEDGLWQVWRSDSAPPTRLLLKFQKLLVNALYGLVW